jgi:tungstate transport system substrate-binding protein
MINAIGAEEFANWIISDKVQALIADFGIDKYGEGLFIPNAK